ncbi:MAG: hypothetical protein ACTS8P_02385 [Arsenophonus sp. NC-XBC3-MAG3]
MHDDRKLRDLVTDTQNNPYRIDYDNKNYVGFNEQVRGIELVHFNPIKGKLHSIKFVKMSRNYVKYNNLSWELILSKLLHYLIKGSAAVWAKMHSKEWGNFREFEETFKQKYWSVEQEEVVREKSMGRGNFYVNRGDVTELIYIHKFYN